MKNKQITLIKERKVNTLSPSFSMGDLKKNSYDLYTVLMKTSMKNYNINKDSTIEDYEATKTILNNSGIKIKRDEKNFIRKINNFNKKYKRQNSNLNKTLKKNTNNYDYSNETLMSISVPKENYYINPLHSLGTLKINNKIHANILQSNINRQKILYNKCIEQNEQYKLNHLIKMPKIKISRIIPLISNNISLINKNDINHKSKKKLGIKNFITGSSCPKLFSFYKNSSKNFPESREQFSLLISDNILYLIGGICCVYDPDILWTCDLVSMIWTKYKKNTNPLIRFGHISVFDRLNSKIFIYGGRSKYDKLSNLIIGDNSNAFCGMEYYDIKLNKWFKPLIGDEIGYPPLRRNHIGEILGNQLIIHGGIDEYGDILNDVFYINLNNIDSNKERWNELILISRNSGPYIYGHSSSLVIEKDIIKNNKSNVYYFPEEDKYYKAKSRIKIRGLYIFGGKKKIEGATGISNDLHVLILGKKPCQWKKIENIKGKKPSERYFHSMNYFEPGNFLIIHGGRNDSKSESFALNDTYIFDLDFYQWIRVDLVSNVPDYKIFARCSHDSVIYSDNLIIFGGMNNQSYLGSSLLIISLNSDLSNINNNINSNKSLTNSMGKENSKTMNVILPIIK